MSEPAKKRKKRKEMNPLPWVLLVVGALVAGIWWISRKSSSSPTTAAVEDSTMEISLPPPPAPPPPPPPPPETTPPPPEDEEMIEQEPVAEDEPAPDDSPPEQPSEDLGTGIAGGNGPDMGLGRNGSGRTGGKGRRGPASRFGWYAAKVQSSIRQALAGNPSTRSSTFTTIQVKIWVDSTGTITRTQLIGSSGDPAVDQAIRNRILTGLQLPQAPPSDLPMPINLRISARKAGL